MSTFVGIMEPFAQLQHEGVPRCWREGFAIPPGAVKDRFGLTADLTRLNARCGVLQRTYARRSGKKPDGIYFSSRRALNELYATMLMGYARVSTGEQDTTVSRLLQRAEKSHGIRTKICNLCL